jgi:hypothetical protein
MLEARSESVILLNCNSFALDTLTSLVPLLSYSRVFFEEDRILFTLIDTHESGINP